MLLSPSVGDAYNAAYGTHTTIFCTALHTINIAVQALCNMSTNWCNFVDCLCIDLKHSCYTAVVICLY